MPQSSDLSGWATGRLLSTAARLAEHAWDSHLAQWDLNHASFAVLHLLSTAPRSQRELAQAMQVEDQTMSRVLERLERQGHVARERSTTDRRRVEVSATGSGRTALAEAGAGDAAERVLGEAVEDLPRLRAELATLVGRLSARRWSPPS
ncbi:MarR family winged helix-turn-helix transcriptional regulator [Klenkia brasiliensis]|uniref:DNA-binding transcriptional regulator, MarR family n=1 Tax=Klenkia brasiliensis TaxID=333142 RepID=A0A1G7XGB1_9ACTN|nr:MarR family transcriptional regulator [Klenkia brasiliensis]SDG82640.1 DNA-binding transcriptional regulator, MarR family [Klenkia brasiliensis]